MTKEGFFLAKLKRYDGVFDTQLYLGGKNQLVVAIGCTGGKHRSVTLANALYHILEPEENYGFGSSIGILKKML